MKQIALIHFLPLEYYPPVTNMINYLSEDLNSEIVLSVFSTHNTKKRKVYKNETVRIFRTKQSEKNEHKLIRFWKYFIFQISVFFKLIRIKPEKILYYESLSSFPVFLYLQFVRYSTKIYIHYHEYITPEEYKNKSMATERFFHKLEQKFLYKKAVWISHTNKDRLNFFHKDNPFVRDTVLKEMPNFPPKSWIRKIQKSEVLNIPPVKCIYIGALSFEETFIKEFVDWVILQKGQVHFDIYSYNLHKEAENFLKSLQLSFINFNSSGIEYSDLPLLLSKYHVGIILYKGQTKNYEFNAPNKFFEYLICGLDVWFPNVMKGLLPYVKKIKSQKVIPTDFKQINNFSWKNSVSLNRFYKNQNFYSCDKIYKTIKEELNS